MNPRFEVDGSGDGGPDAPASSARPTRLLRLWGVFTYGVGGLTVAWGLLFTAVGVVSILGEPSANASPIGAILGTAIASALGVVLLFVAVPVVVLGVVVLLSACGARRGSRRWWLVGMGLYALGCLLSAATLNPVGVALLGGLLALGYAGRDAVA